MNTKNKVVATYHGVEVLDAPHLGPTMINNMIEGSYERREVLSALAFIKKDFTFEPLALSSNVMYVKAF